MSKFINVENKQTIDSLTEGMKKRLNNPYYLFNDKKATIVNYYKINRKMSTLDEGSKDIYSATGTQSPIRYDLIKDTYIFGFDRIEIDMNYGDYGLEANDITGDAYLLPNTFEPTPNDFFVLQMHEKKLLFKVTGISPDTLEDGANFHKFTYVLDRLDEKEISKDNIVNEYKMIVSNVGSEYNPIIRSEDYTVISNLEAITDTLRKYYYELFFVDYLQSFIYEHNGFRFYDPYLVEFLIRNRLLESSDNYIFIDHQVKVPKTFSIDYDRSFFRTIELKTKTINNPEYHAVAVDDASSLLTMRYEKYYSLVMGSNTFCYPVYPIPVDLVVRMQNNDKYDFDDTEHSFYNIIISYYNGDKLTQQNLDSIENIQYTSNIDLFYIIPIIIYILEYSIKELLK